MTDFSPLLNHNSVASRALINVYCLHNACLNATNMLRGQIEKYEINKQMLQQNTFQAFIYNSAH